MKKAVQISILSAFLLTFMLTKTINVMQYTEEIWKDVVGYEGLYRISSHGRITNGKDKVKAVHIRKGYYSVILYNKTKWKNKNIHRLVATHFIENPNNLPQVNHKDGNKLNNKVSNLEWCTAKYNIIHSVRTGLRKTAVGEAYGRSSLNEKSIILIRSLNGVMTHSEIAKAFGIAQSTVTKIITRLTWKHIL